MNDRATPARAVVEFFLQLAAMKARVQREFPDCEGVGALIRAARQGRVASYGLTSDGLEYRVHGVGCLFSTADGLEVDVDLDVLGDGREHVDLWRLHRFVDSAGLGTFTDSQIAKGCAELVDLGVLEETSGWWKIRS